MTNLSSRRIIIAAILVYATHINAQKFNPPTMGWSSWNTFALNINEDLIKSQADAMVKTGLAKAGYKNINIDDGYWDGRGEDGTLRINTERFPNGMRHLTDYIHGLGLKAGIYSDTGPDCWGSFNKDQGGAWGKGVGLLEHEDADCRLYFDEWNFDFIKVDNNGGYHYKLNEQERYSRVAEAIRSVKKKNITYNICCGFYPGTWVNDFANSWRTTYDIYCAWKSVKSIILENLYIQAYTGSGHYNDADMLEIGRTLSPDEETTHMAYWCITSSPLLIGCDLTNIPQRSLDLLKNPDLIAMNQDRLGVGAPVVQRQGEVYVVAKDMKKLNGSKRAVVVMNLSDEPQTIPVSVEAMGFEGTVKVYDCLTHKQMPKATGTMSATIPAHGSLAFFVTGKRSEKHVYQAEEAWVKAYREVAGSKTAMWEPAEAADQGEYMGYLGGSADNALEWKNVYSEKGGRYTLSIRFATGEPRNMTLWVNGQEVKAFNGLNSGSYIDHWSTAEAEVTLRKGMNVVRLSNDTNWMPNIDCMRLTASNGK